MFNKNPSFGFSKLSCLRVELGGVGGGHGVEQPL